MKNKYQQPEWLEFRECVFSAKGKCCEICNRDSSTVVIQCHHEFYDSEKEIWEYDIDDITVICKGCHAREHNILEPNDGWSLIEMIDRGDLVSYCERQKSNKAPCNIKIRYEYIIVHPKIYESKIVGSECIEHLTEASRVKVKEYKDAIKMLSKINKNLKELDEILLLGNFSNKQWQLITLKKSFYGLFFFSEKTIGVKTSKIKSEIKKAGSNFSATLFIDDSWYKFKNKSNNKVYSKIYGSIGDIGRLLILIQEYRVAKLKEKNIIESFLHKELCSLLKKMNYVIVKPIGA